MLKKWISFLFLLAPLLVQAQSSPADAAQWLKETIAPCFTENDKASLAAREKIERTAVTPTLKALFAKDNAEKERTHEVTKLDFDWIMNAQDITTKWQVGQPKQAGKYIAVPVETKWSDTTTRHVFLLQPSGDSWLIADVQYPGNDNLLKILQ